MNVVQQTVCVGIPLIIVKDKPSIGLNYAGLAGFELCIDSVQHNTRFIGLVHFVVVVFFSKKMRVYLNGFNW